MAANVDISVVMERIKDKMGIISVLMRIITKPRMATW
ncbi:hypothetical protein AYI70_g10234, partial [Smittium culicis]